MYRKGPQNVLRGKYMSRVVVKKTGEHLSSSLHQWRCSSGQVLQGEPAAGTAARVRERVLSRACVRDVLQE